VHAVLRSLLAQSSILPASICAQLFCQLPVYVLEQTNATRSLSWENEEWKHGGERLGMAPISVFCLARAIPYGDQDAQTAYGLERTFPRGWGFSNSGGNQTLCHLQNDQKSLPC